MAGQFVMSGFLNFKMAPWKRSCVTRTVAIVPTLIIAVVFQASHKLDQLNQLLNILQSIMLPFAIIPVSILALLFLTQAVCTTVPLFAPQAGPTYNCVMACALIRNCVVRFKNLEALLHCTGWLSNRLRESSVLSGKGEPASSMF